MLPATFKTSGSVFENSSELASQRAYPIDMASQDARLVKPRAPPILRMHSLIRSAASLAFGVFYRRRLLGGKIPTSGPVILVANHPNGLVDAVALLVASPRPPRFLAKAPLFEMPILGALLRTTGALPVYRGIDGANTSDNRATFAKVHTALASNQLVCLFPEGISHSKPALQTLKTGAARMALGALTDSAQTSEIKVLPVGLIYGRKTRFRSRMAIWVGEAIEAGEFVGLYHRDQRAAVRALTDRIATGLRQVTIQLSDWHDLPLIELAERLLPRDQSHSADRTRALAEGLHRLRCENPQAAAALEDKLADFRDRLEYLQLAPEDLDLRYTKLGVLRFALRNGANISLTLPLASLGALIWWLPYQFTGWISRQRRVDADIVATQKFLLGFLLFPLWLAVLGACVWHYSSATWAASVCLASPILGVLSLRFGDRYRSLKRDVSSFFRFNAAESLKAKLRERRDELLVEIQRLAAEQRE